MKQLLIVDDDEVTREVLCLLSAEAGFEATAAASGDAALLLLDEGQTPQSSRIRIPDVILTDLQMEGVSGEALARALRTRCGTRTRIIAMSASASKVLGYDGFLMKPFTMKELRAVIEGVEAPKRVPPLKEDIFLNFGSAMGRTQRRELYAMCLADAERRVVRMRKAIAEGDGVAYTREAHALKGGCGIVGATELHELAAHMEETGLGDNVDSSAALGSLEDFLSACDRLRGVLDALDLT